MTVTTDGDLARGWAHGDPHALEAAFARHAADLLLCAGWLTGQPDAASDAVRATFVRAAARIGRLRDGQRLHEFLFAILRNECLLRPSPLARIVPLSVRQGDDADVWIAAQALEAREREVFAIHVCAGLDTPQLAAALGVKLGAATVRVAEMREALRDAVTALELSRDGLDECPVLAGLLAEGSGPFTAELRSRVERHAAGCARCSAWPVGADDVLGTIGALPVVPVPLGLLGQVRAGVEAAGDLDALPPVWGWKDDGFPAPLDGRQEAAVLGLSWTQVGVAVVVVLLLVAALFGAAAAWSDSVLGSPRAAADPVTSPSVSTSAGTSDRSTGAPPPATSRAVPPVAGSSTTSRSSRAHVVPPPVVRPTTPATSTSPSPSRTTPPPAPGRIVSGQSRIDMGYAADVRLTVRNSGGQSTSWTAGAAGRGLSVSPSSGRLGPGQSASVVVHIARSSVPEGTARGTVTVAYGGGSVAVPVSATVVRKPVIDAAWVTDPVVYLPSRWCSSQTTRVGVMVTEESKSTVEATWSANGRTSKHTRLTWAGDRFVGTIGPFETAGSRTVKVVVTDEYGATDTTNLPLTVRSSCF